MARHNGADDDDDSASTLKLLVTTDNHLGFAERDARRGDDSFTTFEEVLRAARVEHDVDAMLLGGDLFHENKPSLGCLVRTCSLFRKYVLGSRAMTLELLSDAAVNFPTHAVPLANFHDPNINVALPVFAIHGNHDDPVGGTSSLDLLATNGYLNYFGHVASLDDVVLHPVLLRKGATYVALYGLGNVRDERLHRCFQHGKVRFARPPSQPGRRWFTILLLHQNRGVRAAASRAGVHEHMLAGYGIDLVIWGNEHEQRMVPEPSHGFDVVQPGSTILTSLSASEECNAKQYGVLEVRGTSYRLTPCTLRSVRPVVRRVVVLSRDCPTARTVDAVEAYLHGVVAEMVHEAEAHVRRLPDDVLAFHPQLKYPLMRLLVDYSDAESTPFPQPNANRFGQAYLDVVANPADLLRAQRPRAARVAGTRAQSTRGVAGWPGAARGAGGGGAAAAAAGTADDFVYPDAAVAALRARAPDDIRAKVADVFQHNAKDACTLLSEPEVTTAVYAFAEKGEREAIDERIAALLDLTQRRVWSRLGGAEAVLQPDAIRDEVERHKLEMNRRYARAATHDSDDDNDDDDDDGEKDNGKQTSTRPTTKGGGSSKKKTTMAMTSEDDNTDGAQTAHDMSQLFDAVELVDPFASQCADATASSAEVVATTAATTTTSAQPPWHGGMRLLASSGVYRGDADEATSTTAATTSSPQQQQPPPSSLLRKRARSPYSFGLSEEELDALEALPGDGLDRIRLDALVAHATADVDGHHNVTAGDDSGAAAVAEGSRHDGKSRGRTTTTTTRASRTGTTRRGATTAATTTKDGSRGRRRGGAASAAADVAANTPHDEQQQQQQQPALQLTVYGSRRARQPQSRGSGSSTTTTSGRAAS